VSVSDAIPFLSSYPGIDSLHRLGKTSLTQQYVAPPTYIESYFPTIEATSHKHVTFDGVDYTCEIIDSAGQVRSTRLTQHKAYKRLLPG